MQAFCIFAIKIFHCRESGPGRKSSYLSCADQTFDLSVSYYHYQYHRWCVARIACLVTAATGSKGDPRRTEFKNQRIGAEIVFVGLLEHDSSIYVGRLQNVPSNILGTTGHRFPVSLVFRSTEQMGYHHISAGRRGKTRMK